MKKILNYFLPLTFCFGFVSNLSFAQVNMSTASGTYPQNFNTLASSGTGITWTDNSTIPNWYCQRTGTGSVYDTNDGTVTTAGSFLFSFGSTGSSDRALGSYGSAAPGNFAHGVLLRNTSGATMTNIRVSWTLEQWRNSGTNNTHTIFFWYKTSPSTITTLNPAPESGNSTTNSTNGWTAVTALNSNAPLNGLPIGVLDGNAIANKVSKTDISIPSLSLANNSYIMLKWDDPDQASGDQSMAIDDVTIAWGSVACTTPTAYNVTGTGSYCTGGTGVAVGLDNSETGVTYQLKNGATNVGTAVSGTTGSAITFGNQTTATTYTVVATRTTGGCTATMTGSAVITVNNCPTLTLGTPTNPLFCGASSGSITFTCKWIGSGTQTINYQKDGNSASASVNVVLSNASDGSFTLANLGAGLYSNFTIGTANATGTRSITNNAPVITYQSTLPITTCGGANGIIYLNTTYLLGGTYTVNFQKDGTPTTATVTVVAGDLDLENLSKGTYSNFSVTSGSCTTTYSGGPIVVNDPATATLSVSETLPLSYCGSSDAELTFNPSISLEDYSLSYKKNGVVQTPISIPSSGSAVNTFGAGNYTEMKITGVITGCISTPQAITINNPATSLEFVGTIAITSCGAADGSITFNGVYLSPTPCVFSYKKDGVAQSVTLSPNTVFNLTPLGPGVYGDFVAHVAEPGCIPTYSAGDIEMYEPIPLFLITNKVLPTNCNTNNGSFGLTNLLSNELYTVSYVKNGAAPVVAPYTTDANGELTIAGLGVGNYTDIKVTHVATTCVSTTTSMTSTTLSLPTVIPSVTIVADQTNPITAGSNVTFTATPINGGTAPTYQWNGNAATTSNTYMDATLADGDIVNCLMTSNAACPSPTTATSNTINIETCNCSPTCSRLPTAANTYDGAIAYTDANGVTHYCDEVGRLLLSTKPVTVGATTVILPSAVQIKIGLSAATFYPKWCGGTTAADKCFMVKTPATGGNVLINRWWHINDAQVTGTAISASNLLEISTYFTSAEFIALQNQMTTNSVIPALTSPTSLIFYQPMTSSVLNKFADPALVKPMTFHKVTNGTSAGQYKWLHDTSVNGVNKATFHVNTIKHSGGIGIF